MSAGAEAHSIPEPVRYACSSSEDLTVLRDPRKAHVTLGGRSYDLERQRSSIGQKYVAAGAALIIDGSSAIFVAEDRLDLGSCIKALPLASAR